MKVELVRHPTGEDWKLCKRITLGSIGKDSDVPPTEEWKYKILNARHSPIRMLQFIFKMTDVPYYVSVHMCRHVHATPVVSTQRTDRTGEDRNKKPQDAPVTMWYIVNAEELMVIANKRLCNQASEETRRLVEMMRDEVLKTNHEFHDLLVPMCLYNKGTCHEMFPCEYAEK